MSDEFLGVDDPVVQSVKYEIYPNPAANMLFIKGEPITAKIIITNALGENILETEFVNQLDISSLPVGFYFIRIGNQVEKIVKF